MALNGVAYPAQSGFAAPASVVGQLFAPGAPSRSALALRSPYETQKANLLWFRLNRSLLALREEARNLARQDFWNAKSAVSSDEEAVGVTAPGEARVGAYEVGVAQLAQAEKLGGAVISTAASPLGVSGSFKLNGREIFVAAEDNLYDLAGRINRTATGVAARVEQAEGGFRLTLTAQATGQAGALLLADQTAGTLAQLGLLDEAGAKENVLEAAADAAFTVNGQARSSSTNRPVVEGVELELRRTTASAVTVTVEVEHDAEAISEGLRRFTDAYNSALADLNRMALSGGTLGRRSAASVERELVSALQAAARPAADAPRPTELGLRMGPGGTLSFDEKAFRKAFDAGPTGPEEVSRTFTAPTGVAERIRQTLAPLTGSIGGYNPGAGSAPAASWLVSQAFTGYSQPASPREAELHQKASVLQSSLALLASQKTSLQSGIQALLSPFAEV